ncbi:MULTISPECIES: DNA primase family protein [Paraburkholderia]|uniref:DNA primase family protein n=1 Tax=Paraburkholderia TaxID=1822464 RepID=UPI0003795883|nr:MULTISPECIES: DNA primase family protein [Paraburkholderia]MDH6149340.1 putative DNA primase/helicase [Paraburkholderia sp. WSM4179]
MSDISINKPITESAKDVAITFAVFTRMTATQPKTERLPLEQFIAMFMEHDVIADKSSGKLWSPTIYAAGASRGNTGVTAVTAFVIDVDDGTPFSELEGRLHPFCHVVHTSHSHIPEHPKYRVVLPLAAPISTSDWPVARRRLDLLVKGHADPVTKDPARMYFLPGKPPATDGHFVRRHDGRLISVDDLPALPSAQPSLQPAQRAARVNRHASCMDVDDVTVYEAGEPGLEQVLKRCHFMNWASAPANQNAVSEPEWRAMISNASRFQGGRDFAHAASCHHDDYTPEETDARLARHLSQSGPITCAHIQSLGFNHCPRGGCVKPSGEPTGAPAGLASWPTYFEHDDIPHPVILRSFLDSTFPEGLLYANGEYNRYRAGAYEQLDEKAEIEQPIAKFLGNSATATFIGKLTGLLAIQQAQTDFGFTPNLNHLCLTDGTLNLTTFELEPHSPGHRLRTRLEVAWDPGASCPRFVSYLDGVFQSDADKADKIAFVQQWLGYLLVPDTSLQKMLWLVGAGANGKSVLLAVVNALVGEANISHAMLDTFHQSHVRAELDGKLVNIAGEMAADSMIDDGYIKAIVAGDTIEASRKYKPSKSFRPFARLMAATNNLPRTNDLTHGFFRRTIILSFNRKFAAHEQNPNLVKELLEELPGILAWAVAGLRTLRQQGHFTIPASSDAALEQYRAEANPVKLFADECLVASQTGRAQSKDLLAVHRQWCGQYGFNCRNVSTFGRALGELGFEQVKSNGTRYWRVAITQAGREYGIGMGIGSSLITAAANDSADAGSAIGSELASRYSV